MVLAATGTRVLFYDHLVEGVPARLRTSVRTWRPSPWMDLTGGMDGYLTRASKSGKSNLSQARRRGRQAVERLGELRFEPISTSHALLDQVIELKRGQYAATGSTDYFAPSGRRELLHRLLDHDEPGFSGVLSAVHCGDTLVAGHFGIKSDEVLHWWFPVYAPELGNLSPGWILLRELIAAAPELGVRRLDLGRGEDEYKRRAMTGQDLVGQGFVAGSVVLRQAIEAHRRSREIVTATALAPKARRVLRRFSARGRT